MVDGQMGIHVREDRIVLGIDPGRDKTGFAFADMNGELIASGIFPTSEHAKFFAAVKGEREALTQWLTEGHEDSLPARLVESLEFVAIGDGTYSRDFAELLRNSLRCTLLTVDERNTTLEARKLYWRLHAPSCLLRLVPEGLRVPNRVLDDIAAWAIALRALIDTSRSIMLATTRSGKLQSPEESPRRFSCVGNSFESTKKYRDIFTNKL